MAEIEKYSLPREFLRDLEPPTPYDSVGRWPFETGNPEYWKFGLVKGLTQGAKVLDIGIGKARSSFPFALLGAEVDGVDISDVNVDKVNKYARKSGLPNLRARYGNVEEIDLVDEAYDLVIIDLAFVHFKDAEQAIRVLDKAYNALKKGGKIFVRAVGKEDGGYQGLLEEYERREELIKPEDLYEYCTCSGITEYVPVLYLPQTGLLEWALKHKMGIVHSQTMPEQGQANLMYGEDWTSRSRHAWDDIEKQQRVWGYMTLIAEKI